MLITIIPVVLIIVGAAMYVLCEKAKLVEIGRLIFFAGILAFAFAYSHRGFIVGETADVRIVR